MRRAPLFLAIVLLMLPAVVLAQTAQTGILAGTAKDQTGAVLPGVTIEAKHQQRGTTRSAVTDAAGRFRMGAMSLGMYSVTGELSGFSGGTLKDVLIESDKTTDVVVTMGLGPASEAITVTGDVPVVDRTNVTVTSRVRSDEFQKLPVGRSYQAIMGLTPGIPGTGGGNVNALGSLTSNNQFLFDGVDTTDPTTGTFGSNLNFEAIQEVSLYTAGLSAEYGRAVGAIVNVITKSGGNDFSGSAKYLMTNDNWNGQNRTKDERCGLSGPARPANPCDTLGSSLARVKFDHVNPVRSFTLGGPIWRDRVWFFGAYEKSKNTTAQQQTAVTRENFQQTTISPFWDGRITAQITPSHSVWVRKHDSPTNGFVVNYGNAAELAAYTGQDQTGNSTAGQYTGIFGPALSVELFAAKQASVLTVYPLGLSALAPGGAVHFSSADGFYYNGAFFDGFTDRPRKQFIAAVSLYKDFIGRSHDIKIGYDQQTVESGSLFTYQGNQLYVDASFDPITRNFVPSSRRDYDAPAASTSEGKITALYARDKLDIVPRLFAEIGVRYEKQTGDSDVGTDTIDTSTFSPRLSMSYDVNGDGRSIVVGSYARPYQFITQGFSDSFAIVPQQGNYTNFTWDGTKYVQGNRIVVGGSNFRPDTELNPSYVDELTLGYQRQLGRTMGAGIRGIYRTWGDLIDDVRVLNADGSITRNVVNYDGAEREYRGLELTFEKRFSKNWAANVNYTFSEATGNHFADSFSSLGDFLNTNCRTTTDPTIGTNGTISCAEVQDGSRKNGLAAYDRPHDLKAQGSYVFSFGPVRFTTGLAGEYISGITYTKNITVNVLIPGTTTNSGQTATYFYEDRGSDRLPSTYFLDGSLEATWRFWRTAEFGIKGEIFNLTDHQDKTNVNLTTYCADTAQAANSTCSVNRSRYGLATARGSFRGPRTFRVTTLIRF